VRYCDPGEFGKIVGIDRIPEVKTLREKIELLSNIGITKEWSSDLAKFWMEETPEISGTLYIIYRWSCQALPWKENTTS